MSDTVFFTFHTLSTTIFPSWSLSEDGWTPCIRSTFGTDSDDSLNLPPKQVAGKSSSVVKIKCKMSTNRISTDFRRRSSVRLNRPPNIDLILSPNKPALSETRIAAAAEKAEVISKIVNDRSKTSRLSDLILLQKTGRSDAIVNLTNHEFNFLINQIIPLVMNHEANLTSAKEEQLRSEIEEGKNMVQSLNQQICDFEIENEGLKHQIADLEASVTALKAEIDLCHFGVKSTLELTNPVAFNDIDFRLEQYRLENLVRLDQFDSIISVLKSEIRLMLTGHPRPRQPRDGLQDQAVQEGVVEEESHREKVFTIVSDDTVDDMPPLENDTDEEEVEVPSWMSKVVPQPDVPSTPEVYELVSELLDLCAASAVNRARNRADRWERRSSWKAKKWGQKAVADAPMTFEVMTPEEAAHFDSLEDKRNNHFSILLAGMQVPEKIKKLETVMKYEREYAVQMTKNIYPQFHESCIKHIKSLKPPGQPWSKPYSLKVTYGSEHVRQHVLAGAAHANLLVRPYMNQRQFEHFREKQKERYQVTGTSVPGPAFLANGGVVPRQIHPSMEAGFEAWQKEYQRRKQLPKREIVLGGRRKKNMTTVTIDMPSDPVEDVYWTNALERAYQLHVKRVNAPMPYNGPVPWAQDTSRGRDAPPIAETVTWPLDWQSQQNFIHTWIMNQAASREGQ